MSVPEGWRTIALEQVCDFLGRGQQPRYTEGSSKIAAINQKCVRNGRTQPDQARAHDDKVEVKSNAVLRRGDVCVNSTGTGTAGRVGIWDAPETATTYFADSHITIVRPSPKSADPFFIASLLNSAAIQERMNLDCFTGSTNQIELSRRNFSSLELLLPPLAEQRKIAEILGSVDEAIAATQAVIDQTRRVKQGLLQQLLTRGIGHTRFKQTEIGEIPESWEVVELEKLTECITKGESPRWQGFEYQQEGILFVTSENVRDRFLDLENPKFIPAEFGEKLRRSRLVSGDVLVNIVGASIGRASLYERNDVANVNQAVAVVRPIRAKVLPRLLLEAIYATRGQAYLGLNQVESARPNVSLTSLRNFPMIVPPITEQQKIVEIAEGVDAVIEAGTEKLHQFHRLKSGLMSDLLTGRVRVKVSA